VPDLVLSNVDSALTVKVAAVSLSAMVNVPSAVISVPFTPPSTLHITSCGGSFVPFTAAVNDCVAPLSKLAAVGFNVTLVTVGVSACAGMTGPTVSLLTLPIYPLRVTVTFKNLFSSAATNV